MYFNPLPYQDFAIKYAEKRPFCGLFLDMGLGKTAITLSLINAVINELLEVKKVLVVAPPKVAAYGWTKEVNKWSQSFGNLTISECTGTEKQRIKALNRQADIYTISKDSLVWLVRYYGGKRLPFDMLVVDELSFFKDQSTKRFKALRRVLPSFKRVVGLTGTPCSNGLINLWSQMYILDRGKRLGEYEKNYKEAYFTVKLSVGNIPVSYNLRSGADKTIKAKIRDICISMSAEDYLPDLPEKRKIQIDVHLSEVQKKQYKVFQKEKILEFLEEHSVVTAANAGVLANKLLQFSNGAIYDEDRNVLPIHDEKIKALKDVVETTVSEGKNMIIAYQFIHDIQRIKTALKGYKFKELKGEKEQDDWNAGKIQILLMQSGSNAYGLNLQEGGSVVVWFGLTWSLEKYLQLNARLARQGQTADEVIIYHLVTIGTYDERVVKALQQKDTTQRDLLYSLRAVVNTYKMAA